MQPLSQQGGSEGCRVIAFDRPPYGLSERPMSWPETPEGNPYTSEVNLVTALLLSDHHLDHNADFSLICLAILQAGARYAEGLLKALGVQQAIAVGHSAGALTAMELFKR